MRRAVRCNNSIWFGRPSVEMKIGCGGEICAICDELKWVNGVTCSMPSMCSPCAPCDGKMTKKKVDKWGEIFFSIVLERRQLKNVSTHDSPVAPNVGSAVGGVAWLLFVYAAAWSDGHWDYKLERRAASRRCALDTVAANVVWLELKDGSLGISQLNLVGRLGSRLRSLQIEMCGAG